MKTNLKKKEVVILPMAILSEETPEERRERLLKLTRRLSMLMREIDVWNLDVTMFSKTLSEGKMPRAYYKEVQQFLDGASLELSRISEAWQKLFKEKEDVQ